MAQFTTHGKTHISTIQDKEDKQTMTSEYLHQDKDILTHIVLCNYALDTFQLTDKAFIEMNLSFLYLLWCILSSI